MPNVRFERNSPPPVDPLYHSPLPPPPHNQLRQKPLLSNLPDGAPCTTLPSCTPAGFACSVSRSLVSHPPTNSFSSLDLRQGAPQRLKPASCIIILQATAHTVNALKVCMIYANHVRVRNWRATQGALRFLIAPLHDALPEYKRPIILLLLTYRGRAAGNANQAGHTSYSYGGQN